MTYTAVTRFLLAFSILTIAIFFVGCTTMIGDMAVSGNPTYEETVKQWPAVKGGNGRVVVYFPRQGAKSFNPMGAGGIVFGSLTVDKRMETTLMDRTFVFAGLPEGKHEFAFKVSGILHSPQTFEVAVKAGERTCVEIDVTYMEQSPPRIVSEADALKALETLHHYYKQALPFHDQT